MSELPGFSHILAGVVCPSAGGQTVLGTPSRVMEGDRAAELLSPLMGDPVGVNVMPNVMPDSQATKRLESALRCLLEIRDIQTSYSCLPTTVISLILCWPG